MLCKRTLTTTNFASVKRRRIESSHDEVPQIRSVGNKTPKIHPIDDSNMEAPLEFFLSDGVEVNQLPHIFTSLDNYDDVSASYLCQLFTEPSIDIPFLVETFQPNLLDILTKNIVLNRHRNQQFVSYNTKIFCQMMQHDQYKLQAVEMGCIELLLTAFQPHWCDTIYDILESALINMTPTNRLIRKLILESSDLTKIRVTQRSERIFRILDG
ncbi:hypothetical protein CAAN3_20S00496 [[Candida] anglica]